MFNHYDASEMLTRDLEEYRAAEIDRELRRIESEHQLPLFADEPAAQS